MKDNLQLLLESTAKQLAIDKFKEHTSIGFACLDVLLGPGFLKINLLFRMNKTGKFFCMAYMQYYVKFGSEILDRFKPLFSEYIDYIYRKYDGDALDCNARTDDGYS